MILPSPTHMSGHSREMALVQADNNRVIEGGSWMPAMNSSEPV